MNEGKLLSEEVRKLAQYLNDLEADSNIALTNPHMTWKGIAGFICEKVLSRTPPPVAKDWGTIEKDFRKKFPTLIQSDYRGTYDMTGEVLDYVRSLLAAPRDNCPFCGINAKDFGLKKIGSIKGQPVREELEEEIFKILQKAPKDTYSYDRALAKEIAQRFTPTSGETYPCADCGKPRTKDEGGTTFTVCDECWDKHYKTFGERREVVWPEPAGCAIGHQYFSGECQFCIMAKGKNEMRDACKLAHAQATERVSAEWREFNLNELEKDWEKSFYESAWEPDTLSLTETEKKIVEELTSFLPRHMMIYDWNLPYADFIILIVRRAIAALSRGKK